MNNGTTETEEKASFQNKAQNKAQDAEFEKKPHSRYRTARGILIFWTLFVGIGAVGGAAMMFLNPDGSLTGMDGMLPFFQVLPFADVLFQNFIFPGIALLIVNGISNLTAAVLLIKNRRIGVLLGGLFGVTLMLWIVIQFIIFPLNFMSTVFFVFGVLQAATGYAALVFLKQEEFKVNAAEYPAVGTDKKALVVYFSRMGYVKKQAYEAANRTGAVICEIKAAERTEGTLGFWWCGRYGMHRWAMPIQTPDADPAEFEHVTIVTPVWVFAIAAPVREFCRRFAGRIREVDYIVVHHMNARFDSAAEEMDTLLKTKHTAFVSIRCRTGKFKIIP